MSKSIERAKIKKILSSVEMLPRGPYRILQRYETHRFVGLMTVKEYNEDSSIGRSRTWAVGVTFDGRIFREPLDMIDPRTHELRSCIITDNGFVILTARKSEDPGNEEENFQWYTSPEQMNAWQELDGQIKMKDGVINEQAETIENLTTEKNHYQHEADRLGGHNKNMITQTQSLSAEVSRLNTKQTLMDAQIAKSAEWRTELMSQLIESFKSAGERGKLKAMTVDEIVMDAYEKMAKREEKMIGIPSASRKTDVEPILAAITGIGERLTNLENNKPSTEPTEPTETKGAES